MTTQVQESLGWKESCSNYLDITPPIVALVASIVSLVVAIYFQNPGLAICAGVGTIGCIYSIYTAYKIRFLPSFAQQLITLQRENQNLRDLPEALQIQLAQLEANLATLKTTKTNLEQQFSDAVLIETHSQTNLRELQNNLQTIENQVTRMQNLSNLSPLIEQYIQNENVNEQQMNTKLNTLNQCILQLSNTLPTLQQVDFVSYARQQGEALLQLDQLENDLNAIETELQQIEETALRLERLSSHFTDNREPI